MSWEQSWREGRTPWDAGGSPPVLERLVADGSLPSGRALVPGCGSGYDVLTLATPARSVIGLEVSPIAAERFEALRAEARVPAERAQVHVADFFDWDPPHRFDLIWDYTFLCALDPARRPEWVERVDALLAPGGELVTLLFPVVDKPPDQGPPYRLDPERERELLAPRFEPVQLEPVRGSHPAREGREWLGRWRRVGDAR